MKRKFFEHVPERYVDNRYIEAHTIKLTFDTNQIKEICSDCDGPITWDEDRFKARGNYCASCNARYSDKLIKIK